MPSPKTEVSELSVAFGILGVKPINPILGEKDVYTKFEGSLPYEKYKVYCERITKNKNFYQLSRKLFVLGNELRKRETAFNNVNSLQWTGGKRQGTTVTSSQDLLVNMVPVSVKVDSNVMYNKSPVNLLENLPQGLNPEDRRENWYIKVARDELQKLYSYVVNSMLCNLDFPANIEEFEKKASKDSSIRDTIQEAIKHAEPKQEEEFNKLYRLMCGKVSLVSAKQFNELFAKNIKTRRKNSVIEMVLKTFFRINSTPYLLAVKEKNLLLVFRIPNITSWKNDWEFVNLTAEANTSSLQSEVKFKLEVKDKNKKSNIIFPFHAEIRWSHGKFCGSPEAKLYKDFPYTGIPFYDNIVKIDIKSQEFKNKIAKIGF